MKPDISISIINTNNREIVLECLNSIYDSAEELILEVIVVNNACKDGSTQAIQDRFPQVKNLETEKMLGFSTNNNLAFSQVSSRYLMLLNDDTIIKPKAFQSLVDFMDNHPEAAVVGASLLNPDGSPQLCYGNTPNPIYEGLRPLSEFLFPVPKSNGMPLEVANVHGACMMVRASAAETIGLLDPNFDPLYSEEVDWCFRFTKAGWKIYHLPSAQVVHLGGGNHGKGLHGKVRENLRKKGIIF